MNPQIEIKHFSAGDFTDKNLLCNSWMTQIVDEEGYEPNWANIYRDPRTYVLVLLVDKHAVSFIVYTKENSDYWYIDDVETNKHHRQKGYSKMLFTWLINNSTSRLALFAVNKISENYYLSLGFKRISCFGYHMILER
jgi:predicted GNAT family acetyltransferase